MIDFVPVSLKTTNTSWHIFVKKGDNNFLSKVLRRQLVKESINVMPIMKRHVPLVDQLPHNHPKQQSLVYSYEAMYPFLHYSQS